MSKFRQVSLLPPSGSWEGSFTEEGIDHPSTYHLTFSADNSICGRTINDKDGKFDIQGHILVEDNQDMKFLWLETKSGAFGQRTMCCGDILISNGNSWQIDGTYETSCNTSGSIRCQPSNA